MGTIVTTILGSVLKNMIVAKVTGKAPEPTEADVKGLIQSKTAQGATGALALFLAETGYPENPVDWIKLAASVIIYAATLYGRVKVKKAIG